MKIFRLILALLIACPATSIANSNNPLKDAHWIVSREKPMMSSTPDKGGKAFPLFRKSFDISAVPSKALLHSTALGIYDVMVNGQSVGNHQLKPGWTDYRKEVTYQTIDITPYLRKGENIICVQLSQGWWAGGISRGVYGKFLPLAFKGAVELDGKSIAKSDDTWLCSHEGPLMLGDIYNGEVYDARKQPRIWQSVNIMKKDDVKIVPFEGPEVRIRDKKMWRHPQSITIYSETTKTETLFGMIKPSRKMGNKSFMLKKGETAVVDLGQNMVGWMMFEAKAKGGTTMTLRHGEMLNDNGDKKGRLDDGPGGSVWTYNLRDANATVKYTFSGNKKGETYHPRHTFMGFRYISITATDDVEIKSLVGQVVGSDIEEWGEFQCSDESINQLYRNIWWGQRGNFLTVPTDCPQRDERLGWTGDTQIFAKTALYNSNASDFYRKWMRDMRNSQREDGAYPDIAPFPNFWGYGTGAWGDAGVIVPWTVYQMTGDKTIMQENYESMTGWMKWLATQNETADNKTYTHIGAGTATGDWLAYHAIAPRYVCMAYYAYDAQLMDSISRVLGKQSESMAYRTLYNDIRKEFQQRYMNADGTLKERTQTAYLLALRFDLLPEQYLEAARDSLRMKIESNDYCLSTGFVGTGILCTTLSDEGMDDLAYALLLQRKNPSWLYSIDQGATTIWERWDSYTKEGGFHKHHWNMNSFNHYAYGAVAEWMYAYIAGIKPGKAGFCHVILAPHVDNRPDTHPTLSYQPRITWAKAKTQTPYGIIESSWKRMKNGHYEYRFTLPKGVTYDVQIPNLSDEDKVVVKTSPTPSKERLHR